MKILRSTGLTCTLFALGHLVPAPAASFVANPSFETNYNDVWPHYGLIDNWTGGSGVNDSTGPFHNGGTPIPDRDRIGFLQGPTQITQTISGLEVGKQYWIQFFYDARACCGGTIDLITEWDDVPLDTISNVTPSEGGAGYKVRNVLLTAGSDTGTLKLRTSAVGRRDSSGRCGHDCSA